MAATTAPAQDWPQRSVKIVVGYGAGGYRLGYGGGFYDRTLAELRRRGAPLAVGVGYAGQEVAAVPHADYDQRLDWMVTERAAFQIGDA